MSVLKRMIAVSLGFAALPAWAGGFCDGGNSGNGSNDCGQTRSAAPLVVGGAPTTNYSDADGRALMGDVPRAIHFDADLTALASGAAPSETVFAEMTFGNGLGRSRTLVLRFVDDAGFRRIVIEWHDAAPYWSTADTLLSSPATQGTLVESHPCELGVGGGNDVNISVVPVSGWSVVGVYIEGCSTSYMMPRSVDDGSYRSVLARVRTGIVSSTALTPGLRANLNFHLLAPVS